MIYASRDVDGEKKEREEKEEDEDDVVDDEETLPRANDDSLLDVINEIQ